MAAKKSAKFTLVVARPTTAEDLVALAYKLENIATNEAIQLSQISISDWDTYHEDGPDGSGVEFYYRSKV